MSELAMATAKLPVLIIEDEPSVMSFVKAALERAGYAVTPPIRVWKRCRFWKAETFWALSLICERPGEWMAPMYMPGWLPTGPNWFRNLSLLLVTL